MTLFLLVSNSTAQATERIYFYNVTQLIIYPFVFKKINCIWTFVIIIVRIIIIVCVRFGASLYNLIKVNNE